MARYVGREFTFAYPAAFTTLPEYTAHAGQRVTVTRRLTRDETDFRMYEIRAADGWIGHAWIDELED